jgi:outer membrane protein insertion porin family
MTLLPACVGLSVAQPVPGRTITGGEWLTGERIQALTAGQRQDSIPSILQRAYAADGFLNARIRVDSDGAITIEEGKRYTIGSVLVAPDSVAARLRTARSDPGELVGHPFVAAEVDQTLQRIVDLLSGEGFPLATARLDAIEITDSNASVALRFGVSTGDRVSISEIDISGNTETSRSLILAAAAIPQSEPFTDQLANQVRTRLVRLNVFTEVEEPQLYRTDSGRYGLLLTVKEGNANTFDGIIGYQPPATAGEDGYFTGMLNFVFRNIGGSGRRFQVRGQWPNKTARELEVRYAEPFILGLPLDIEVGYQQRQEAETPALLSYVQHYLTADLFYGLFDAVSVRLGGALDQTVPQADSSQPCSRQLLNTSTVETTLGIVYDTRSDPVNPVSGARFSTSFSFGSKAIRGPSPCDSSLPKSAIRQRNDVDVEGYLPFGGPFVGVGALHGGDIRADFLQESDLYQFGGQATVRGYREKQFRASRRFWENGEFRFLLSRSSYVAVFFDGGYFERKADTLRDPGSTDLKQWIYGYGVSGQLETPLGLVRLSFALGREDTFETGKVFIGLVNQF